jgi:hypothetical protein
MVFVVCCSFFISTWTIPILVPFVQQSKIEKQTANVASVQDGCSSITLSRHFKYYAAVASNNHTTDVFHSYFCSKLYFLVLKNFRHFILCSSIRSAKFEYKQLFGFNRIQETILKKTRWENNLKTWVQNVPSTAKGESFLVHIPRVTFSHFIILIKYSWIWFLVNDQRDTVLFYVFIFIFNSLHVSNTSCSSSGETICVSTTSDNCTLCRNLYRVQVGSVES